MISQEETIETNLTPSLAQRRDFLKLPLEERRRILAQQADQIAEYYELESEQTDREHWQGGDIVEY
jgi:isopenicillin N synthase-like dioxygenase